MKIAIGKQVQLNSGGHVMTIESIDAETANCVWTARENSIKRDAFPIGTLKLFKPATVPKQMKIVIVHPKLKTRDELQSAMNELVPAITDLSNELGSEHIAVLKVQDVANRLALLLSELGKEGNRLP